MFGKLLGKIVAAPVRILDLPFKIASHLVGDGDTPGEDVAKAIEDAVEDIVDD